MGLLDRVMLKKARFENEETPPELLAPKEPEPEVPIDPDADLERKLCWLPDTPESKSRVTVVSYNVLGRCNADGMHAKSHPSSLTWSFRRQRLLSEIVSYECDVICLQDVDDYHGFWLPGLNAAGLHGSRGGLREQFAADRNFGAVEKTGVSRNYFDHLGRQPVHI